MASERRFRIVMLDECVVTNKTLPTHVWSRKLTNASIDLSWFKQPCKAIILAIS